MNSPNTFRANDRVSWFESLLAYPASAGFTLKYRLLWPAVAPVEIPSTVEGDGYRVSLSSQSTAAWPAGPALLVGIVTLGAGAQPYGSFAPGDSVTIEQKSVTILPNLVVLANVDGRSANKRALDAAEAALLAYLEGGKACVEEYEIAGRKMKFRDLAQIRDLINHYKALVARENTAMSMLQGGRPPGRVHYRG